MALNDPKVIKIFEKIREENIERLKSEVMCEHFSHPRPYHGDMTFFTHEGPPTTDDYLTDAEDCVGPAIGMQTQIARLLAKRLVLCFLSPASTKRRKKTLKWAEYSKQCAGISKDGPKGKLGRLN